MRIRQHFILAFAIAVCFGTAVSADDATRLRRPGYRIVIPDHVLTDVPVQFVRIEAVDADGKLDKSYSGRPLVEGVIYMQRRKQSGTETETALGAFENGVLNLKTDLKLGRRVYISGSQIVVTPEKPNLDDRETATLEVTPINRWWSIVPPLLAIVLAVWLRNVLVALLAGILCGAVILAHGDFFAGFLTTVDTYLVGEVVMQDGQDYPHMVIILFTLFLGAMIGVMSRSGGTQAIVRSLARVTKTREHGQLLTWGLGFAVFFDDYANTLLVGGTMRPVTDKLKISRAKLAFLVDSTAAPVAGIAVISTWVGYEVSLIGDTYKVLFGENGDWNAYSAFIATIPYRFYALHLLVFVLLIAYIGNDFGPMLNAEARAIRYDELGAIDGDLHGDESNADYPRALLRNAVVPLVVLIGGIILGLYWTGTAALEQHNAGLLAKNQTPVQATVWTILQYSQSSRVILYAAFLASASAVCMAVLFRSLRLHEAMDSWVAGAKSMFGAILVLVMAWAIATLCNPSHLNTAGFLVEMAGGRISASWTPALAFILAAVVSFATGSSFATMGLLLPLFITMTFYLLANENDAAPYHALMLATIGAVLAGSIFGDHCSPISDTTVLSSAATGCDHLSHVGTQLPYAVTVAVVALLLGYLPVGFNIPPYILLPLGPAVLFVVIQFYGQSPETVAKTLPEAPFAASPRKKTNAGAEEHEGGDAQKTKEDNVNLDEMDVDWDSLPG